MYEWKHCVPHFIVCPFACITNTPFQALHYTNAMVSMQLTLLRDEQREEASGSSSRMTTVSAKELTCPLRLAAVNDHGVTSEGGSSGAEGNEDDDANRWPDDLLEDHVTGVMVRDHSGR